MYRISRANQERSRNGRSKTSSRTTSDGKRLWHTPGHFTPVSRCAAAPGSTISTISWGEHNLDADLSGVGKDARLADGAKLRRVRRGADHRGKASARAVPSCDDSTSTSNRSFSRRRARSPARAAPRRNCHKSGAPRRASRAAMPIISILGHTPSTACTVRFRKKTILSAIRRHPDAQAIISSPPAPTTAALPSRPVEAAHMLRQSR